MVRDTLPIMENRNVKAVIFDMDGVLINSEPLHYEVDLQILKEANIFVEPSYFDSFMGMTNGEMWQRISQEHTIAMPLDALIKKQLSMKIALLRSRNYQAIPGVMNLIQDLVAHSIPVSVASSSPQEFITEVLDKISLSNYICHGVSAERVRFGKPAPDVFLFVAQLMNTKPQDCIVFEDSENGVLSAKRAGMKVIGYRNPTSGNQNLTLADMIIDAFHDVSLDFLMNL